MKIVNNGVMRMRQEVKTIVAEKLLLKEGMRTNVSRCGLHFVTVEVHFITFGL